MSFKIVIRTEEKKKKREGKIKKFTGVYIDGGRVLEGGGGGGVGRCDFVIMTPGFIIYIYYPYQC